MCGCYLFVDHHPKVKEIMEKANRAGGKVVFKTGDVYPGQMAPILLGYQHKIYARYALWGFHHKIINARSESVSTKAVFQKDFLTHRALVPVSGFYEWDKQKEKYLFQDKTQPILYLAAIYNDQHEFTIITAPSTGTVKDIHHRMPVMILPEHFHDWLFDLTKAKALLEQKEAIELIPTLNNR